MPTVDNQLTQPEFTPPAENKPAGAEKPFFLTRRHLILIVVGGITLLLIFSLGVRAGEKRALRKHFAHPTPTLTPITPSPTAVPPTSPPTPVNQSCFEGDDCVIGIEQGSQIIYSRGICKNGVCIPRPTPVPKRKEVKE